MSKRNENRPGYKKTKIGWMPEEWGYQHLDGIAKRETGHTPSKKKPEYWNGGVKWVSLSDSNKLDNAVIFETAKKISEEGLANSSARYLPKGTVILLRDAAVGRSAILGDQMAVSQHFVAWICGEKLLNLYFYYHLQNRKQEFEKIAVGSTIVTIGMGHFAQMSIPLPSYSEQQKIAEMLSAWDLAITQIKKLIAAKQKLKKGLMQQLLTGRMRFPEFGESAADKGELPKEWKIKSLDLFGSFLRGKGISNSEKTETGIPCITYGEIYTRHEFVIKNFYSFIDNSTARKSQRIKRNDILFAGSGETLDEIGRCVAHTKDIEAYAGGDIVIFRPKGVNPLYLSYSLNSELLIRQKRKLGQGHSVVHIYSAVLKTLQVPLPSFEEQHCVATILSSCGQEIDLLFGKEIAFREQKKGLMQKLLTGEVRAQVMGDGSYD